MPLIDVLRLIFVALAFAAIVFICMYWASRFGAHDAYYDIARKEKQDRDKEDEKRKFKIAGRKL